MNIKRAQKAFEDFTGRKAPHVKKANLPDRDVSGWKMGPVVGIAYQAKRDGKTAQYFHEFKPSARPDLISQDDGKQLYIAGGKYTVTDRGIEDMPKLFVVNPSARKGRAKRKAPMATRRRRRSTVARRRTRQVAVFNSNPIRRRRRRRSTARTFRRNPVRVVRTMRNPRRRRAAVRRFRRNPSARRIGGGAINFGRMILPAIGIGAGAIGSELIMGYLPIPANFKTGPMRHVTKGAVGVAAGLFLGKVLKQKRLGNFFALGAVAIATHDFLKEQIAARAPGVQFGQYSRALPGQFGGMGYVNSGSAVRLGQYVDTPNAGLGGSYTQHGVGGEMRDFTA